MPLPQDHLSVSFDVTDKHDYIVNMMNLTKEMMKK